MHLESDRAMPMAEPGPGLPARSVSSGTTHAVGWSRLLAAAAAALFLVLALDHILWMIAYPLSLVFGGVIIAQGLAPIVTWLSQFVPRPLDVVGLYLALLAAIVGGIWLLLPALAAQAEEFTARLPVIEATLHEVSERWSPVGVEELLDAAEGYLLQLSGPLLQLPMMIVTTGANLVLVFFLSLYWLIAQPRLRGWVLSLVPGTRRDDMRDVLSEIGETIGGYVRGVLISALSVAVLTYIGLLVMGLPSALLLALIAGFAELIPVLGPFLAAAPAVGVALASGEVSVLVVVAFYIGLQQVESNILLPLIMRGQARIPPLMSLVAFLIGVAVGGIVGALIAIPLFGALWVIVVRMLVPAQQELAGVSQAEAAVVRRE